MPPQTPLKWEQGKEWQWKSEIWEKKEAGTDTEPRVHLLWAAVLQQGLNEDVQIFFRGLFSELLLRWRKGGGREGEREIIRSSPGRGKLCCSQRTERLQGRFPSAKGSIPSAPQIRWWKRLLRIRYITMENGCSIQGLAAVRRWEIMITDNGW